MSGLTIQLRSTDLEKASRFLDGFGKKAETGIRQAISRAIKGVGTDSVRLVRENYNVKASAVRRSWKISKTGHLEYTAVSSGRRKSLVNFGSRPNKPKFPRPVAGVSVQVKDERKPLQRQHGNLPFVAIMPNGQVGLFVRTGRMTSENKLQIQHLYGPSVPSMVRKITEENRGNDNLQERAVERFDKNLNHAINRAIQQVRGL